MPDADSTLPKIGLWKYLSVTEPNSSRQKLHEILRSRHTNYRCLRFLTLSHGNAWLRDSLRRAHTLSFRWLTRRGNSRQAGRWSLSDADTSDQLVHKPTRVLKAINTCNLKLSASKTVIVPHKTTILGWIWEEGTLNASPHRTVILSSCEMPTKVKAMHSFIGAYKVLVLYRVFVFSSFGGKHCWFTL